MDLLSIQQFWAALLAKVPSRARIVILASSLGLLILHFTWILAYPEFEREHAHHISEEYKNTRHHFSPEDISQAPRNQTLGFEKIYYISLPYRTDRQDQMSLMAASTGLKINYLPGVLGADIHDKAKPNEATNLRPEQLGCWRSHADAWRKVVEDDVETAIILEDDADWDVNVKDIFQELSLQMRKGKLRQTRPSTYEIESAPYGLDWDILYIGTCFDIPNGDHRPKHHTYNDLNGPNRAEQSDSFVGELEGWGLSVTNSTRQRVIARSWYPVCTIGYAVTRAGAQKLLYTVGGVKGIGSPIDLTLTDRIQKGLLKSYTIIPPLITPWKTGSIRDSDIDDLKEKHEKEDMELKSGSQNLKESARVALEKNLGTPDKQGWSL